MMRRFLLIIKLALIAALTAGILLGTGCQKQFDPQAFHVFYINSDQTSLIPMEYELRTDTIEEQIDEALAALGTDTGRVDYVKTIPTDVLVTKHELVNGFLKVYFNYSYYDMDEVTEVLCRAGVVRTLMQFKEITNVAFFVSGQPLVDGKGQAIGVMNNDSFIDNPGESMQNIQETELTLYFASADGKSLVKEVQKVRYNRNVPIEKRIIERLLETPKSDNAQSAIPVGTKLITVSVLDGICMVNLDNGFLTQNYDIAEEVVIYSIVNSLTELDTIQTVQISVNGETNMIYRESFSLAEQYTRNLNLVTEEDEKVKVVDEEAPGGGVLNN